MCVLFISLVAVVLGLVIAMVVHNIAKAAKAYKKHKHKEQEDIQIYYYRYGDEDRTHAS